MEPPFFLVPKGRRCLECRVRDRTVCASVPLDELAELEAVVTTRRLERGAAFAFEDDFYAPVANVLKGHLKVSRSLADGRTQLLRILRPGDFFAGGAKLSSVAITALDSVELCVMERPLLDALAGKNPTLGRAILSEIEDELADAQEHILALGRMTALERVSGFLLHERARALHSGECVHPLPLFLTRAEIADYLGLTTETVSRCATQLKTRGLVKFTPGKADQVEFLDLPRLAGMTGEGAGGASDRSRKFT